MFRGFWWNIYGLQPAKIALSDPSLNSMASLSSLCRKTFCHSVTAHVAIPIASNGERIGAYWLNQPVQLAKKGFSFWSFNLNHLHKRRKWKQKKVGVRAANTRGPEVWKGRPCNSHCCRVCATTVQETYAVPLNQSKLLNIYNLWFAYCWCLPTFCTKMKFRKPSDIPTPFSCCTQQWAKLACM